MVSLLHKTGTRASLSIRNQLGGECSRFDFDVVCDGRVVFVPSCVHP